MLRNLIIRTGWAAPAEGRPPGSVLPGSFSARIGALVVVGTALVAALSAALTLRAGLALAVVLALPLVVGVFAFPRGGVYLVLLVVLIEGFVRNLVDSPVVLLVKDGVLAIIYLRLLFDRVVRGRDAGRRDPLTLPLLVFAGLVLLQSFNPQIGSPVEALVGIRTWLFYIPIYYVARDLFPLQQQRDRVVLFAIASAVPIFVLGVAQFVAGPAQYAALGPAFARSTFLAGLEVGTGQVYRPNATFSFPSHFALYLAALVFMGMGEALYSHGRRRFLMLAYLVLLVAVVLIENQRTHLILIPALAVVALVRTRASRRRFGLGAAVLAAVALAFVVGAQFQGATVSRVSSLFTNQGGIFGAHTSAYAGQTIETIRTAPFGLGTGATSIGSRYVLGDIPLFVEFSLAKVAGDLGFVGIPIYVWLFGSVIRATMDIAAQARKAGNAKLEARANSMVGFQLLAAFSGYDLAVAAIFLWFFSGLLAGSAPGRAEE